MNLHRTFVKTLISYTSTYNQYNQYNIHRYNIWYEYIWIHTKGNISNTKKKFAYWISTWNCTCKTTLKPTCTTWRKAADILHVQHVKDNFKSSRFATRSLVSGTLQRLHLEVDETVSSPHIPDLDSTPHADHIEMINADPFHVDPQ